MIHYEKCNKKKKKKNTEDLKTVKEGKKWWGDWKRTIPDSAGQEMEEEGGKVWESRF